MENEEKVIALQNEFYQLAKDVLETEVFLSQKKNKHHKYTTVYEHVLCVAYESFLYAKKKGGYDLSSLVRGALLHDFYLYDRFAPREETKRKGLHGYTHPGVALENASKYFNLNEKEKNIIINHMWPLTLFHMPKCKEAWLVSRMDKRMVRRESRNKGAVYEFAFILSRQLAQ